MAVVLAETSEQMRALGVRLGRLLRVGDVVALVGGLGAGKTTFAQGIAEGIEVPADREVSSPTFALVNEHPGRVSFVHADLYRLEGEGELEELGLSEAFDRAAAAIEWADRFPEALPADHVRVEISLRGEGRALAVTATGPRGAALMAAWLSEAR